MANNLTLNDLGRTLLAQLYQITTGGDEHVPHPQKRWSERSRESYRLKSENLERVINFKRVPPQRSLTSR